MENKVFTAVGMVGAAMGIYLLGAYFINYVTGRFMPTMKQLLFFLFAF